MSSLLHWALVAVPALGFLLPSAQAHYMWSSLGATDHIMLLRLSPHILTGSALTMV